MEELRDIYLWKVFDDLENMKEIINKFYECNLLEEEKWNKNISEIIDVEFVFREIEKNYE